MIRIALALLGALLLYSVQPAQAQTPVALNCWQGPTNPQWAPCNSSVPLAVTIVGGGGGGLSVLDGATFTASTSNFTPGGGEYASAPTTCADGKQCTFAITTQRALTVDVPTSNNNLYTAITSPIVAGTNVIGFTSNDACQTQSHSFALINVSASGLDTTPIVVGTSAKKTYICQIVLQNNAANNVAVFEATNAGSCGSGQLGMWGSTTAAAGFNFSANGGISIGSGGYTVAHTTVNQNDICVITSAATQLSGRVEYAVQ